MFTEAVFIMPKNENTNAHQMDDWGIAIKWHSPIKNNAEQKKSYAKTPHGSGITHLSGITQYVPPCE